MTYEPNCYYCDRIASIDSSYTSTPVEFDTGSEAPRCAWHWRLVCDHCTEPGHFMVRYYCPSSGRLLCRSAGPVKLELGDFWAWQYWWELKCPDCGERHPSLDYAEYSRSHPWQLDEEGAKTRRWLSTETQLKRYPPPRAPIVDPDSISDADSDESWSANADFWDSGYEERGDDNRKYRSDPVLLEFLGDVRGKKLLDAGSGNGYLSRLLARRGASVVAVEVARRFHEIALTYQEREPLDVEYHHASISDMPFLADSSFDAVVANYVLMDVRNYEAAVREIARVLRPGGSFVCVLSRPVRDGRWHTPALDSPRREDRVAWMEDDYFIRRGVLHTWPNMPHLKPTLTFHRPLRDYIAACGCCRLELRDLEEPEVSEEGKRELPPHELRHAQRTPLSYVLRFQAVGAQSRWE